MPIYAYICPDCGFEKDQLQKLSDAPLTQCPSCSGGRFARKLTAPAFQLKGTGWYVTDFRDGQSARKPAEDSTAEAAKPGADASAAPAPAAATAATGDGKSSEAKPAAATKTDSAVGGSSAAGPASATTKSAPEAAAKVATKASPSAGAGSQAT
jgi:putative FmdB family regulatory protein